MVEIQPPPSAVSHLMASQTELLPRSFSEVIRRNDGEKRATGTIKDQGVRKDLNSSSTFLLHWILKVFKLNLSVETFQVQSGVFTPFSKTTKVKQNKENLNIKRS